MLIRRVICVLKLVGCAFGFISGENNTLRERIHHTDEYCNGETFRPRCSGGKHDVIVILSARYGRMSVGRCLRKESRLATLMDDHQFLGCSSNVKEIIDQQCSGKPECDVRINDQQFDGIKPCYDDLKLHLEASYTCVKVAAESRHCTVPLANEPQHIVGGGRSRQVQTDTVGCGTESQPWSIEALSGQRIAVSLIDFETMPSSNYQSLNCQLTYGVILDRNARKNVSICRTHVPQQLTEETLLKKVYNSSSNRLQVIASHDASTNFIIRVEAVGCSDLAPPSDSAWLKRFDDQITVGCYLSRQSWKLNCVNGVWTGTVGVCSEIERSDLPSAPDEVISPRQQARSHIFQASTETAALAAVASAGIALCCLIICVGVYCLRRQQRATNKKLGEPQNERSAANTLKMSSGLLV